MRMALAMFVMCAALGACAQGGGSTSSADSPAPSASSPGAEPSLSSPTSPTSPGSTTPTGPANVPAPSATGKDVKPGATTTMTGTVTAGVEPNCLVMNGHLLVGGPRDIVKAGANVTVTGKVQPDMMTTCQQGTPFLVESAKAN
jgi:hypothetical protein